MNSISIRLLMLMLLAALAGCSSSSDDPPTTPIVPDTPSEFTARGWQFFESAHFTDGLADFEDALALDANYGEALAGRGWCLLKLAVDASGYDAAVADFLAAVAYGETESYVVAGQAAARLAQGGLGLSLADNLAMWFVSNDPNFIFSHQPSINGADMIIIAASARAAMGHMEDALYRADLLEVSNIDPDVPSTWLVGGTSYNNFKAAVLAHIFKLSELHSG